MSLVETKQGTLVTKRLATRTDIQWDPATNGGTITFYMEKFSYLDGELMTRIPDGNIRGDLTQLMERSFLVQTGPESTMDVPATLVMATMKAVYEQLYTEQNQPAPPIPVPEPET